MASVPTGTKGLGLRTHHTMRSSRPQRHYSLLSGTGSVVVDLNNGNSTTDTNATVAGYAVYDAQGVSVQQFVLFNYATSSAAAASFALPETAFTINNRTEVTIKYLSAQNLNEKINMAWAAQTLAGVENGVFKDDSSSSWANPNKQIDCSNGCLVEVPPTTMAVVFAVGATKINAPQPFKSRGELSVTLSNLPLVILGLLSSTILTL
ncbi:hypothetical protein H0H81_005067 [Sphagnurus paluster]|uniref:Beta-glucuronidase C-terminal domain-containing protein n=1 Tax=Sphagnurus paluster TaxID=117069 RepID=A0A9P7GKR2_9AGAR|nr:hypothetical protein H0H81_005067 [Sphagnurus paluster]